MSTPVEHSAARSSSRASAQPRHKKGGDLTRALLGAGLTGALVLALGLAAVSFKPAGSTLALWWPAAGVATAAILLTSRRHHWALLVAVGAGALGAGVAADRPLLLDLALMLGNVVTPGVFAWVMARGPAGGRTLLSLTDLTRFCLATAIATGAAGLTTALVAWPELGADAWVTGLGLTAAHAAAVLVIVPLVLVLPEDGRSRRLRRADRWVVPLHLTATIALVAAVYGPGQSLPLALLVLPVLMFGAIILPPRWVSAELLLAGTVTSMMTAAGYGPLALSALSGVDSPLVVVILGQVTLVCYALAAVPMMITAHQLRAAAAEAARTAQEYRSVVRDAQGTAIIGFALDGTVEMFSTGAEAVLGYPASEVLGTTGTTVWQDRPEMAVRSRELGTEPGFETLVAAGPRMSRNGRVDWAAWRADGSAIVLALRLSPRFGGIDEGVQTGWIAVAEDVTHRRGVERALRAALERERIAREHAEQLESMRAAFVATASHELRTPLTSMIGYTALALDEVDQLVGQVPARHRNLLEAAHRNSQRLLRLVEDLLVLSRIEAGTLRTRCDDLDVRATIEGALEALGTFASVKQVAVDITGPAESVRLWGDVEQVERVLVNLLTNAVKFSPVGSTVSVEYGVQGAEVFVRVHDQGPGVAHSERSRIFESFYQGLDARAQETQGSGLGLSIARSIAEAHAGSLRLLAPDERGASFELCLPRVTSIPQPPDRSCADRAQAPAAQR